MIIRKEDYRDILEYLINERSKGKEYIAFLEGATLVGKEELFAFSSHYDVQEFCYEMSTDIDDYNYLPIT